MPITIKEQKVHMRNVLLNYAEGPASGRPLLLLHGGSSRWQNSEVLMPDLANDWHLFALDFRGHGHSERTPGHYRLQDFADDVATFLNNVVGEPAVILGHSLGGMVALMVAGQHPQLVRAVVVGDSPLSADSWRILFDEHREEFLVQQSVAGGQASLEEIARVVEGMPPIHLYHTDPSMYTAFLEDFERTAVNYEPNTLFPAIQCPVLLMQADPATDGAMTDEEVAQAMKLLSHPTHIFLPGISHVLHNEQKEPVLETILMFLNSL